MKLYGIIYCAYNKINQKRYIGQTIHLSRAFKEQGSSCVYTGYTFYKIND